MWEQETEEKKPLEVMRTGMGKKRVKEMNAEVKRGREESCV